MGDVSVIDIYTATALQVDCAAVNPCVDRTDAIRQMLGVINNISGNIAAAAGFTRGFNGTDTRLIVLPEYFLSGFPMGEPIARWQALAALEINGPVYEALSKVAQDRKCYLSGNAYETDPNFPDLYFQCSFLIAPSGEVVLRYRRLISLYSPTPFDVWEQYLDLFGLDGIFPVANTDIGRIGCLASEEILYPELARCLAMRGMEILCHSTSEVGSPGLTPKEIGRRARAIENSCYVVSANTARILNSPIPKESTGGMSKVVDYKGQVLGEAYPGESFCSSALIEMDSLRKYRRLAGMNNLLSRQPLEIYAAMYAGKTISPPNTFIQRGRVEVPDRSQFERRQQGVIERLSKSGII